MTQDEIIRMAREAGFGEYMGLFGCDQIEHFAALVAAHERETTGKVSLKYMNQQVLAEREACAKVCEEEHDKSKFGVNGMHCAAAIRARSQCAG